MLNIHRIVIPSSSSAGEDGLLIQAHYTIAKNIISIIKLRVHTIIDDVIGCDIGEDIDFISHLFMTKLVEADLNEL